MGKHPSDIWLGSSKGHHFIRLDHGGGQRLCVAPRETERGGFAVWMPTAMALTVGMILATACFYLHRLLKPSRHL